MGERAGAVILSWHRVAVEPIDPFGLCTPPETFRAQLRALAARRRILPLAALVEEAAAGGGGDAAALTFDDGYEDALSTVAPLLAEAGACATFFLTTAPLAQPGPFFWDELTQLLLGAGPRPSRFEDLATATPAEREASFRALHARALALPLEARDELMARLRRWAGDAAQVAVAQPLGPDGVRALAQSPGCAIGAHGVHHLALPALDGAAAAEEARASRSALAAVLGRAPEAFAYPFGACSPSAREGVAAAGFSLAVTVEARALEAADDRLRLPRIEAQAFLPGAA